MSHIYRIGDRKPLKVIRPLTESEIEQIRSSAARYLAKAGRYSQQLARI